MTFFDRCTPDALRVIKQAHVYAKALRHGEISSGHLMLALSDDHDCIAAHALRVAGIDHATILAELPPSTAEAAVPRIPFTAECRRVIENSVREALRLGQSPNHIGTEHLLLAVMCDSTTLAGRIAADHGALALRQAVRDYAVAARYGPASAVSA